MILSNFAILAQLENGEIFKANSWDPDSIKEASYALRVANSGMVIDGDSFGPDVEYPQPYIEINPGRIAILSTKEILLMPNNLVGKLGIRLDFAARGLVGFMGIQVDPGYGQNIENERLYIRVANLGNEPIRIMEGDPVFNIEFHAVWGQGAVNGQKESGWSRLQRIILEQNQSSWTYETRVRIELEKLATQIQEKSAEDSRRTNERLTERLEAQRDGLQTVVLFGIFLVAVTILGVVIALILDLRELPSDEVPGWIPAWGWIVVLITLSLGGAGTFFMGFAASWKMLGCNFFSGEKPTNGNGRANTPE